MSTNPVLSSVANPRMMDRQASRQGVKRRTHSWLPNWLKAGPFIGLHLALLTVFLVPVSTFALVLCAITYLVRMFGITGGYHRYFAHRAYRTSRIFQFVLAWLGCSAMQKGPLWWAGHHREHHRFSDTPRDPHSPYETSFWWSHVGWILSEDHVETPWEVIPDWSTYPELRWLDRNHWVPGLFLAGLCFLVGGWSGLVWGFVVSTILVYHATFAINSLNHLFGKRRYATPDDSRNNLTLALLTLGEGWHNNHHHYQSSANQGFFWWEIDITYYTLWVLRCLGLVWDLRKPGAKALTHRLVKPVVGKVRTPEELAAAEPGPVGAAAGLGDG
jgi:stearoyl-CoA desaturase (delta-9 desaturase)